MTCVIGYHTDSGTWIGADSAGTDGWGSQTIRADTKVFSHHGMTMGFSGSFRMGQLLRFEFIPSEHPEGMDDYEYMVRHFVNDVRKVLKRGGFTHVKNNVEIGGEFLVAYRNGLYCVEEDFQVGINTRDYAAIGSGATVASGAMAILVQDGAEPSKAIRRALKVASEQDAFVAPPFVVRKHVSSGT